MFASQHVLSHQISLDIDLYCQHVFWLAGYLPPIFPQLALEVDLGSDCHGSSNGLVGKYQAVLFIKEWLTYLYMCLLCSYAANFHSPLSRTNNVLPILGAVCGGAYCEATSQVSQISPIFSVVRC